MRSIQVDEEVFAQIQKVAVPLVDDANMALRRVFGLQSEASPSPVPSVVVEIGRVGRQRVERGRLTPHLLLRRLIFEVLVERGGSAPRQTVLSEMAKKNEGKWTEEDLVRTDAGEWKWENRASWERQNMTAAGFLDKNAGHGIWRLSEAGKIEARSNGLAA